MAESNKMEEKRADYSIKKCPHCYTPLAVSAEDCYACHNKVGEVDKHGMAQKPTDWKGYVVSSVLGIIFIAYIVWAFF